MAAPPITERHLPHFHRRTPVKESVRVATTANITISTALNVGDSIDGVTLADQDRVLVKDQSTGSQNGIYLAGATPVRDYDESTDDPGFGYLVYVREGTAGGGTLWRNTNTSPPTIGTTAITFATMVSTFALTIKDEGTPLATAATSIDFVGAGVTASGTGAGKTVTIPGGASALDDLTDVTITSAAVADRLRFDGTVWRNSALIWQPLTDPSVPDLIFDTGTGDVIMTEA